MFGAETQELNALSASLGWFSRSLLPRAEVIVRSTASRIQRDAQIEAPVDTGNLRSSIGFGVRKTRYSVSADIGPTANYGGFVEMGTSVSAPQPFMGPAFDRHAPGFEHAIGILAGRIIDEV